MKDDQNRMSLGKNLFPGAVDFVEIYDIEEDEAESTGILSFDTLREAFATLHTAEVELAQTISETELAGADSHEHPECPDYDIQDAGLEYENDSFFAHTVPPAVMPVSLERIVEAMLFVGNRENRPLATEEIAEKLRNVSAEDIAQAVVLLNEHYQTQNRPYMIISESGGYRMVLRAEFESVRTNFYGKVRETRLSQHAVDTLAVVAYRQPVTAEEISRLRKQSCSGILNQLVRRNLLCVRREIQEKKSVVRYHTTSRFLELLKIKSLEDIPKTDEWDYR